MNVHGKNSDLVLSVVMPVFNEEATISQIVRKVLQTPKLLELIIVDDCSTDNTPVLAQNLASADPRIKYVPHSRNSGKTEALKTGFPLTRGDIFVL